MNSFFTSIGSLLAEKHKDNWVYYGDRAAKETDDIQTERDGVMDLLKEIEVFKSSGMDL